MRTVESHLQDHDLETHWIEAVTLKTLMLVYVFLVFTTTSM